MRFLKKSTSIILALSMLLVCSVNVFASDSADAASPITIRSVGYDNSAVADCVQFTANYKVTGATPKNITVLFSSEAIGSENFENADILYIDQKDYATNSTSCNFLVTKTRLKSGSTYYFYMGGTDIDTAANFEKSYSEGGEVIPPVPTGVELTGTVITWSDSKNNDIQCYLYDATVENSVILKEVNKGTLDNALDYTVSVEPATANVDNSKKLNQNYSFAGVPNGNYKVVSYKTGDNSYAPVIESVTVENEAVTVPTMFVPIYGDVNGDGKVTAIGDRLTLVRYFAGWDDYPASIIDMNAADVNADGKVNAIGDRLTLVRYFAGWDDYTVLPHIN